MDKMRQWPQAEAEPGIKVGLKKERLKDFLLIAGVALFGMLGFMAAMVLTSAHAHAAVVASQKIPTMPSEWLQIRIIESTRRAEKGSIWSVQAKSRELLAQGLDEFQLKARVETPA